MKKTFILGLMLILAFSTMVLAGCSTMQTGWNETKKQEIVLTGIFDNDLTKIQAAYDHVQVGMTKEEIVAIGFDSGKENVRKRSGPQILGEQVRPQVTNPEEYKKHVAEQYKLNSWTFPYVTKGTNESHNFLSSSKSTITGGVEKYFVFIFYEDKLLVKPDPDELKINTIQKEEKSPLKGLFDSLLDLGGRVGKRF